MADELLAYYEKELAYIRQLGAEFAEEHPKIASRLGINSETIEDPHVSRLVESFSYLNARIQHKLDDDFPELTDSLLNVLFPHYLRPIPSTAIVQFTANEEQLDSAYTINRHTLLETEQFKGEDCCFSTVYETELLPVTLASVNLMGRPFSTPGSERITGAESVLKISLDTFNQEISFADLKPEKLRFYLKGQSQHINPLYQMLLRDCQDVVLARSEDDAKPVSLGRDVIKAVGFAEDEALLPYPAASFMGYRLISEFFAFPDKYMFIDITDLSAHIPGDTLDHMELYIYLNSSNVELEHNISEKNFKTGCTPVINLFPRKAEPVRLTHSTAEYQVIPDMRRPAGYEVYSVDDVVASTSSGDETRWYPFYGLNHDHQNTESHSFWFPVRRSAKMSAQLRDDGTDVFLNLVDLDFNPNLPDSRTLHIQTTCSNRDLPEKLPYSTNGPELFCTDGAPPCKKIRFVSQPGRTIRPPSGNNARWKLISHLNLNHLSITGHDNATSALKEILRLYNFNDSSASRHLIESIVRVDAHSISAPLTIDGHAAMCRGIEIEIELDERQLTGSSSYLFATVLEHFFSLYCTINSFTRVLVKTMGKEGYLKKCPPRAGVKVLL